MGVVGETFGRGKKEREDRGWLGERGKEKGECMGKCRSIWQKYSGAIQAIKQHLEDLENFQMTMISSGV